MEENKKKFEGDKRDQEIVYSKAIKAGKRIYYLDVKRNRKDDLFLAITESKKKVNGDDAQISFEKHKIFLYKEDFDKFADGLKDAVTFIGNGRNEIKPEINHSEEELTREPAELSAGEFTNVDFDDLGKK